MKLRHPQHPTVMDDILERINCVPEKKKRYCQGSRSPFPCVRTLKEVNPASLQCTAIFWSNRRVAETSPSTACWFKLGKLHLFCGKSDRPLEITIRSFWFEHDEERYFQRPDWQRIQELWSEGNFVFVESNLLGSVNCSHKCNFFFKK